MDKQQMDKMYIYQIQDMISKQVLHREDNAPVHLPMEYCHNIDTDKLPVQGWKIHISVRNLADYANVLKELIPKLEEQGFSYKLVNPQFLENQLMSIQQGKAITIYMTPGCDLQKLFPRNPFAKLNRLLREEAVNVPNEQKIGARVFARYGAFRGEVGHSILNPAGHLQTDNRHQAAKPNFVSTEPTLIDISNFYSQASQRYAQTHNYKDFIEESFLGTHTYGCQNNPEWDSRRHNFITIDFNLADCNHVKSVIYSHGGPFSGVFRVPGAQFGIIHNTNAKEVLEALTAAGIPYARPDWDKRYNVVAIDVGDIPAMNTQIDVLNSKLTNTNGLLPIESYQLANGMMAVLYDTTLDKEFTEICQWKQIQPYDICLGKDYNQIAQNWAVMIDHAFPNITYNMSIEHSAQIDMGETQKLTQDMFSYIERQ